MKSNSPPFFKVSYVGLPVGDDLSRACPVIYRSSHFKEPYYIELYDADSSTLIEKTELIDLDIWEGPYQYYIKWKVLIYNHKKKLILSETLELEGKVVFVSMSNALGDTIAWIPYIEEFRKKHKCIIICSCKFQDLFIDSYPDIVFINSEANPKNIYAQYKLGVAWDGNPVVSPTPFFNIALQKQGADILGLEYKEISPKISVKEYIGNDLPEKYICLSEYSSYGLSGFDKEEWQKIVDSFIKWGYKVVIVSYEATSLKGVINKCGLPLIDITGIIKKAACYIGVSSGISWLSWAIGVKVIMLSASTPDFHEFKSNVLRISHPDSPKRVLEKIPNNVKFDVEEVIQKIKKWLLRGD